MAGPSGNLTCDCNSDLFYKVLRLQTRQGLVEVPFGYRCVSCGAVVDAAYLTKRAETLQKRKELQQLQTELEAETPARPVPPPAEPAARR